MTAMDELNVYIRQYIEAEDAADVEAMKKIARVVEDEFKIGETILSIMAIKERYGHN